MNAQEEQNKQFIFTIDNGTQSVRAILFDLKGNIVAKGREEIEPYFSKHPGWAEQDPEYYWSSLAKACDKMWSETNIKPEQIVAATITTQRGTVVNLGKNGEVLRPAIVWLDQRRADVVGSVPGVWKWLFKVAGVEDIVHRFREKAQSIWMSQHQKDIWKKTHKFLLLSGYLTYKMTGNYKDSTGSQVGYIPFDYKKLKWASESDWRFKVLQMSDRSMLPDLVNPGESLGSVSESAAKHTGLPVGLPVIAAASDKACEILGSGGNRPDIACMSYGTTATINTTNKKYVEPIKFIPAYPSAIPGAYSSEIMIYRGFWMVSWFKKEFGQREQKIAEEKGVEPEELFDELVNKVPAGSMGLMLQPYWSPGVRDPGPEAKGSIIGFGDVHTRSHIYRAILEGLAYGLKEGMQTLEKRNGVKVKTLRVSGGGSQSDAAMQLTADIFGMPAERPHTYETSGLGAAIDVAVGLGIYKSIDEGIDNMTRVGKVFEPNPESVKIYDRLYRDVYLKMYKQLQPLYKNIREITGYPE